MPDFDTCFLALSESASAQLSNNRQGSCGTSAVRRLFCFDERRILARMAMDQAMLARIRRLALREGESIREIARRLGVSRNTVRRCLRTDAAELNGVRAVARNKKIEPWIDYLTSAMRADVRRPRKERRNVRQLFEQIRALGYDGSYGRVTHWVRIWRRQEECERHSAHMPLSFELGEAFQFDWSVEYAIIGGVRSRLDVAHTKLAASRAFWLTAYRTQTHEMLFDAHARAFAALGGVPRRGLYDNMKTAVDKIGVGKARSINARFQVMCSHYLFEPEFCNPAAGWEKGRVEKNVQDRRRQIWREVLERRWPDLATLNEWLAQRCRSSWPEMTHPDWPDLTVADVYEAETAALMPCPVAFDGYVEHSARVTPTALVHFDRNRYSVPVNCANGIVSIRAYPDRVVVVREGEEVATHPRSFERDRTYYEWQHYIALVEEKPGALRNGAPFKTMPALMQTLQRHLLRRPGGDRVMAKVLSAVPQHGLEAVLVAVELVLEAGRPSAEHVLNVLGRLQERPALLEPVNCTELQLKVEPIADVARYDLLRETKA